MKKSLLIVCLILLTNFTSADIYYGDYSEKLFTNFVDIPIIAVSSDYKAGILGQVRIALIKNGNNKIIFDSRTNVDSSTIESVVNAHRYAMKYAVEDYDYFIAFDLHTESVSGMSTGGAIGAGMVSLVLNQNYNSDYLITGAIDSNGVLIPTGGLDIKTTVAGINNVSNLIIPYGQSKLQVYEKVNNRYLVKEVDLIKNSLMRYNLLVIEAHNIDEILKMILIENG